MPESCPEGCGEIVTIGRKGKPCVVVCDNCLKCNELDTRTQTLREAAQLVADWTTLGRGGSDIVCELRERADKSATKSRRITRDG